MPIGLGRNLMRHIMQGAHLAGAARLAGGRFSGIGTIFMLHRVSPSEVPPAGPASASIPGFAPNGHLTITPDYLAQVIRRCRELGIELVSLDAAVARIASGDTSRRFAAFTLDDGFRDNLEHAYPVFRAVDVPFTVFVTGGAWPEGRGVIWWLVLEAITAASTAVDTSVTAEFGATITDKIEAGTHSRQAAWPALIVTTTAAQKRQAFVQIDRLLAGLDEDEKLVVVRKLAERHGIDADAICARHMMTWDEIGQLAADDLATIGAHTLTHPMLARLPEARMRAEMVESRAAIERRTGRPCRHFAYPYGFAGTVGPREFAAVSAAGFASAVIGRGGPVMAEHRNCLTSLPRIALVGGLQDLRCLEMLLSGLPFVLRDRGLSAFGRSPHGAALPTATRDVGVDPA